MLSSFTFTHVKCHQKVEKRPHRQGSREEAIQPRCFGNKFVVPPHFAAGRWTLHENQSYRCLHHPGLEVVRLDGKGRVRCADGEQGSSRCSVFLPAVPDRILESVSVPQSSKCHSLSSSTFCPSIDRAMNVRPLKRMQVARAVAHGPERPALREKRSSGSRLLGAASSNARDNRNFRITCRGSHPWNQPKLCLHRRLKRQYILHLFAHTDVVASRIQAYGVPLYSMCKGQTSLAVQRFYHVNLRRDYKHRRIAGALLTPPRGTGSLSIRCLDTCCFLARQLHVARKPRISSLCPPADHIAEQLGHDYRFVWVW